MWKLKVCSLILGYTPPIFVHILNISEGGQSILSLQNCCVIVNEIKIYFIFKYHAPILPFIYISCSLNGI